MQKMRLIGNLTRDPELRFTPQGTPVATFSVASNHTTKRGEETQFFRVVSFGRVAESAAQNLSKGARVYVSGRFKIEPWTDRDGNARISETITLSHASGLVFLSRPRIPGDSREVEAVPELASR